MISPFKHMWLYLFGPRLYKIYRDGPINKIYSPNGFEKWGDQVIYISLNIIWKITVYTSPLIAIYLYKKDYMDMKSFPTVVKLITGLSFVVTASHCLRAYGRATNLQYREFIKVYAESVKDNSTVVNSLRKFDFDFEFWPVNYNAQVVEKSNNINYMKSVDKAKRWKDIPLYIISDLATRIFALRLIYPGSMSILQMTISKFLLEGRIKLVELNNGIRYKIRTRDNNDIDCMFIDRRNHTSNGKILVITSEGNAGFYEIGMMTTPIEGGYSVLGWNHPGFAGSTGKPYPLQEHYAMDAVIQFAIQKLGFIPETIILYGWSIGCYTVAWAAGQYPNVKGIILDATFDDILPLATARMPPSWSPLVELIIRNHVNLNIAELLKEYNGPMKIIRRTLDEIICLEDGKLSTNRGNDLLIKILTHRYPYLFDSEQRKLLKEYLGVLGPALSVFKAKDHQGDPDKNKKVLFLASEYLVDYQSTHCTPLPVEYFHIPHEVAIDEDFVYT